MGKVLGSIPSKSTFFLEVLAMFLHALVVPVGVGVECGRTVLLVARKPAIYGLIFA
jgi:hypothetical protein